MSVISSIKITHHQLPLDPPFAASWDPRLRSRFPVTIARVIDSDGRMGIGSGDVLFGFADYAHHLVGHDPRDLDRHAAVLANIEFQVGPRPPDAPAAPERASIGDAMVATANDGKEIKGSAPVGAEPNSKNSATMNTVPRRSTAKLHRRSQTEKYTVTPTTC